ncbi:Na+/H+ antiporter NhaC [Acidaminobacter sp. JC074]|uniref:Na+/H+ antiporter NhaC n=1 Tax=Acidaminobacter sp. JC074 TaxID=2530199 RepID=UPI001F0EF1FF|nr:Na+/H+ antiporter NhaC [Acidaminobacter sp. JC074]MCH4887200.1 Na+/H+ antiporter NhaC [Acidaminobacter sp. JC074]
MELKKIGMLKTVITFLFLMGSIAYTLVVAEGVVHVPLLLTTALVCIFALSAGRKWEQLEKGMVQMIARTLPAVMFIFLIGIIIGLWIKAGIVPTLVYWGLKIISPKFFLVSAMVSCSIVSIATGSSWTVIATIGIALLGVGNGLGIPPAMTAGAIISGSYFGDKMSPLSETTNLAPAVTGVNLFDHIKHMVYTTGASYVIAFIIYLVIGLRYQSGTNTLGQVNELLTIIESTFNVSLLLLLCPVIVIVLVIKKFPPLPSLFIGAVLGGIFAIVFQGATPASLINVAYDGYVSETGVAFVDSLFSKGGINSMYYTIGMIVCAMMLGGALDESGMLVEITTALLRRAKSNGSLILAVVATCIGTNIVGDQYLAIVLPGKMYKDEFIKRGLDPKNLSRTLEDAGTLTSVLIPWNTCGAYVSGVIGIHPFAYLPYAFLNLINPVVSVVYGYLGITMAPLEKEEEPIALEG